MILTYLLTYAKSFMTIADVTVFSKCCMATKKVTNLEMSLQTNAAKPIPGHAAVAGAR